MSIEEGSAYIDWDVLNKVKNDYNMNDDDIFKLFVIPALDDAVRTHKKLIFPFKPDLPIDSQGNYSKEWLYLKETYGYKTYHEEGENWVLDK